MRDLLDIDNSKRIRVSKTKGVAKNMIEQFVANAGEAISLIERAMATRRYRVNGESFIMLQFAIVFMESRPS